MWSWVAQCLVAKAIYTKLYIYNIVISSVIEELSVTVVTGDIN